MRFHYQSGHLLPRRLRGLAPLPPLLPAQAALAQSPASLRGTVTDALSGQPLAGVRVVLLGQPGGTATDALGQFRPRNLWPGAAGVQVSGLGYRATSQAPTLLPGETRGLALAAGRTFEIEAV